ncbi:RDD family protein [Kiritimatiellota bacterium B12222]|nr:RDD family protein [Kiritimatiellota bacterium B12222]
MQIFYAIQNQQHGPVPLEDFKNLLEQGTITPETLVYTDGMSDWLPLSQAQNIIPVTIVPPVAAPADPVNKLKLASRTSTPGGGAAAGEIRINCPNCGIEVPASDLIPFQNLQVCPHCRNHALQQVKEGVSLETFSGNFRYAGFGVRLGSYLIDYVIMQVYTKILSFLLIGTMAFDSSDDLGIFTSVSFISYMVLAFGGSIAYFVVMMGSPKHQGTLGMKALKLKIVRPDGSPITKKRALGRYLASFISSILLLIGYLMVLWDAEKRTLHDMIADTRIVYK